MSDVAVIEAMANIRCIREAAEDPINGVVLLDLERWYVDTEHIHGVGRTISFDYQYDNNDYGDLTNVDIVCICGDSYETLFVNVSAQNTYLWSVVERLRSTTVLDAHMLAIVKEELLRRDWEDRLKEKLITYMKKTYRNIGRFVEHKGGMDKEMFPLLQRTLEIAGVEPAYFADGAFVHVLKIAELYMQSFMAHLRALYKVRWEVRMLPMRRRMIPLPGFDYLGRIGKNTRLFPACRVTHLERLSVLWG